MSTRWMIGLGLAFLLAIPASASPSPTLRQQIELGRGLAQTHCATCHAIGRKGQSPNPQAPRFRYLAQRYPIDDLAEAFSEGILVGHGPMPEFQFEPAQIDGLIAYLKSIQNPTQRGKSRATN